MKNASYFNSLFVVGWNVIHEKNSYQIDYFRSACVSFKVFVTTQTAYFQIQKNAHPNEFFVLYRSAFRRFLQIRRFLSKAKKPMTILLAPSGRFAIVYVVLAKFYKIKIVAIEWGDLYEIDERHYITKFFYLRIMRCADVVWYKEPYMRDLLLRNNVDKLFYLPNSVSLDSNWRDDTETKSFDFIWANRHITSRYPELLITSLVDLSLDRRINCMFIGLFNTEQEIDCWLSDIGHVRSNLEEIGIVFKPFSETKEWISRSRFFVLLADHVFGNNSLLETISSGLVPLVNNVEGIQDLVTPHISGFLCDLSIESLKANILYMLDLSDEEHRTLALNGRTTIESSFDIQRWQSKANLMFKGLHDGE